MQKENVLRRSAAAKSEVVHFLLQLTKQALGAVGAHSIMHTPGQPAAEAAGISAGACGSIHDVLTDLAGLHLDAQPNKSKSQPDHASLLKAGLQQDIADSFRLDN